jgi:RNA polymerase sigma factor (sigma-70 family)
MQWRPLLYKLAGRFEHNHQDREDLVQDTIATALHLWQSYRPDNSMSGWLTWQMRSVITGRRRKFRATSELPETLGVAPTQEGAVLARAALSRLGDTRGDRMLVRLAMGADGAEIGASEGISRERVRQLTTEARRRFAKRVGVDCG